MSRFAKFKFEKQTVEKIHPVECLSATKIKQNCSFSFLCNFQFKISHYLFLFFTVFKSIKISQTLWIPPNSNHCTPLSLSMEDRNTELWNAPHLLADTSFPQHSSNSKSTHIFFLHFMLLGSLIS